MLAILAFVCFVIAAIGKSAVGPVLMVPLGLALLTLYFIVPYGPLRYRP